MNKVKFGLENVHIFPVEKEDHNTLTYGAPFKLPGAVSLSLNPDGERNDFAADNNSSYWGEYSNDGYEGDLTIALITEEFELKILGYSKDTNGVITESLTTKANKFAMAFEFDGDKEKTRHVLYYCTVNRPSMEAQTVDGPKTPSTDTLAFKAGAHPIVKHVKSKVAQNETAYNDFFNEVYMPVGE